MGKHLINTSLWRPMQREIPIFKCMQHRVLITPQDTDVNIQDILSVTKAIQKLTYCISSNAIARGASLVFEVLYKTIATNETGFTPPPTHTHHTVTSLFR